MRLSFSHSLFALTTNQSLPRELPKTCGEESWDNPQYPYSCPDAKKMSQNPSITSTDSGSCLLPLPPSVLSRETNCTLLKNTSYSGEAGPYGLLP